MQEDWERSWAFKYASELRSKLAQVSGANLSIKEDKGGKVSLSALYKKSFSQLVAEEKADRFSGSICDLLAIYVVLISYVSSCKRHLPDDLSSSLGEPMRFICRTLTSAQPRAPAAGFPASQLYLFSGSSF